MEVGFLRRVPKLLQRCSYDSHPSCLVAGTAFPSSSRRQCRSICVESDTRTPSQTRRVPRGQSVRTHGTTHAIQTPLKGTPVSSVPIDDLAVKLQLQFRSQLSQSARARPQLCRKIFGLPAFPSNRKSDSYCTFTKFSDDSTEIRPQYERRPNEPIIDREEAEIPDDLFPERLPRKRVHFRGADCIATPTFIVDQHCAEDGVIFEGRPSQEDTRVHYLDNLSKRSLGNQTLVFAQRNKHKNTIVSSKVQSRSIITLQRHFLNARDRRINLSDQSSNSCGQRFLMTSDSSKAAPDNKSDVPPAHHRPLVVGLTKPSTPSNAMASSEAAAAFNHEIEKNVRNNTKSAGPADEAAESSQPKPKKEKAPKQPKPPKAAPVTAPTSPAMIDLRVGHILRAIAHPNADSLYVSTIAMGDPEGTEHTQVDEETGKVVRTVCSGLNGLVPLAEMQDRKIIVVANLKPVNMRSIKSAAMVLAASPKQEEGADPHAPDRVVELVSPPEGSEAGDKVYFEGWPYGDGKGPEKQLNPKKKQWEAIQPGFYTTDDLKVAFDASKCDEVAGSDKGNLVVEGKGVCSVKTLKDAVVR